MGLTSVVPGGQFRHLRVEEVARAAVQHFAQCHQLFELGKDPAAQKIAGQRDLHLQRRAESLRAVEALRRVAAGVEGAAQTQGKPLAKAFGCFRIRQVSLFGVITSVGRGVGRVSMKVAAAARPLAACCRAALLPRDFEFPSVADAIESLQESAGRNSAADCVHRNNSSPPRGKDGRAQEEINASRDFP